MRPHWTRCGNSRAGDGDAVGTSWETNVRQGCNFVHANAPEISEKNQCLLMWLPVTFQRKVLVLSLYCQCDDTDPFLNNKACFSAHRWLAHVYVLGFHFTTAELFNSSTWTHHKSVISDGALSMTLNYKYKSFIISITQKQLKISPTLQSWY